MYLHVRIDIIALSARIAKGTTIEIMMVYNQDQAGAKPIEQVMNRGISYYCSNKDTKANLEAGLSYRLKMLPLVAPKSTGRKTTIRKVTERILGDALAISV